jgi:hypothetical protein
MATIGIVQVDGKYPNLALMQITAYHEQKGDHVEWYQGGLFSDKYEKVYASKIFSFSKMPELPVNSIVGGTGIDYMNRLPKEIETYNPSYTLYPECNYHLGFTMKGCRFVCKFCCVPQKEGKAKENSDIDKLLINPNGGNRLMLLDNDFFGGQKWKENLDRIIELKLKVCFVQGLNIRIITSDQAALLAKCNYQNSKFNQKYLTFAWDRMFDKRLVMKGIHVCNDAGIPCKHMQFFVLIGFNSTPEQDYERVMTLRELGCMPFVMPYQKDDPYQKSFARWVNNRAVFKTTTWKNYKYKNRNQL